MKKTRGLVLILSPLLVGVFYFFFNLAFSLVNAELEPVLRMLFYVLFVISFILMIVWIVLLANHKDSKITVKEAIGYGWEHSKKHTGRFLLWFGLIIVFQIINAIYNPQDAQTMQTNTWLIIWLIVNILDLWIMFWLTKVALDIVYKREYSVASVFIGPKKTLMYIITYILNMIITMVWLLLLVFPGIIRWYKLSMAQYLILEKDYNPFKAIKTSRMMTKWFVWDIFAINLIAGLINILWVLAILVWLIWTIPIALLANAYIYKKIADANKKLLV